MHAVVDAASIAVLVWGIRTPDAATGAGFVYLPNNVIWSRFLLYTVLAFGTQFSIGAIADRWKAYRGTLLAGLALIAAGVTVDLVSPAIANVLAALGNAAFHVGAGAMVLTGSPKKTAAAGVFVGPGALGLAVGVWWVRSANLGLWIFLILLAVCAAVTLAFGLQGKRSPERTLPPLVFSLRMAVVCVGAIFLSIAIRSANGHGVWAVHEGDAAVLWGLAIAACMGNILGGFVADRFGWVATCVFVLLLSAPLLSFFVAYGAIAVLGMLLFQMTMPITLTAVWRVFPGEAGLAFGLGALAVLAGVIPVYICPVEWLTPRPVLLCLSLIAVAAILTGLPPIVRRDNTASANLSASPNRICMDSAPSNLRVNESTCATAVTR